MATSTLFHPLTVTRLRPEAGDAVVMTLRIPPALLETFDFQPGQFLTIKANVNQAELRRSYSICSTPRQLKAQGELEVGIRVIPGGLFSNWVADTVKVNDVLSVMAPDGRFVSERAHAHHRVGIAAGSGITPILSIMRHVLETEDKSQFTLIYGNRNMASVMFNEVLQDLKDQYPDRVSLVHVLSRQAQEVELLMGRIDEKKIHTLLQSLLPVQSMEEVFVCGPEAMIEATEHALTQAGVSSDRIHSERFGSTANGSQQHPPAPSSQATAQDSAKTVAVTVVLDGVAHPFRMSPNAHILDMALSAGLDLPYSCKGGVCCTCRAKVMHGSVRMDKNFTLEKWETDQGFVLSCQAIPTSDQVTLSFDER